LFGGKQCATDFCGTGDGSKKMLLVLSGTMKEVSLSSGHFARNVALYCTHFFGIIAPLTCPQFLKDRR
jgi:hypothetical protein